MFKNIYKLNTLNVTKKITSVDKKIKALNKTKQEAKTKQDVKTKETLKHKADLEKKIEDKFWKDKKDKKDAIRDKKISEAKLVSLMKNRP
jgi:hypothetical protein